MRVSAGEGDGGSCTQQRCLVLFLLLSGIMLTVFLQAVIHHRASLVSTLPHPTTCFILGEFKPLEVIAGLYGYSAFNMKKFPH